MKISLYTLAKNAIRLDFHLKAYLEHHLQYADEIVIVECYSKDKTLDVINNTLSNKIKLQRVTWTPTSSYLEILDQARRLCTGDWCIKLDIDEFIPEWEWKKLRQYLEIVGDVIVPIKLLNFYGNYKVYHSEPEKSYWPHVKWPIHRNCDSYEVWGDSSNVRMTGKNNLFNRVDDRYFEVHHFGAVRYASKLREKWRTQAIRNQKHTGMYKERSEIIDLPAFFYKVLRHNWLDKAFMDFLKIYDGPVMDVVRSSPEEFIRDNMKTYNYIKKKLL